MWARPALKGAVAFTGGCAKCRAAKGKQGGCADLKGKVNLRQNLE